MHGGLRGLNSTFILSSVRQYKDFQDWKCKTKGSAGLVPSVASLFGILLHLHTIFSLSMSKWTLLIRIPVIVDQGPPI